MRRRSSGTRQAFASQANISLALLFLCLFGGGLCGVRRCGFFRRLVPAGGLFRRHCRLCTVAHLLDLRLAEELDGAAGGLDLLARGRGDGVHADGELLLDLAVAEELHVDLRVLEEALLDERVRGDLGAGLEAVEVAEVDRLGRRAERADRHRVGGRVAAQLADAHEELRLAALEAGRHLVRARAGLLALDTATGVAALARAEPSADALAVLARLRRRQIGEIQLLLRHCRSSRDGGPCGACRRAPATPRARRCGRSCRARGRAGYRDAARTARSGT